MATHAQGPRTDDEHLAVLWEAVLAGREAVRRTIVQPMAVVGAGGVAVVEDGASGWGWVSIEPGTQPFAEWCLDRQDLTWARRNERTGGVELTVWDYNQSAQKKAVHATAMAEALRARGVECAAHSAID